MIKFILKRCNDIMFVGHFRSLLLLMLKSEGSLSCIVLFKVTFSCVYSGTSYVYRVIIEHITCLYLNTNSKDAVWSIKVHWNHSIYNEWSYYFRSLETVNPKTNLRFGSKKKREEGPKTTSAETSSQKRKGRPPGSGGGRFTSHTMNLNAGQVA